MVDGAHAAASDFSKDFVGTDLFEAGGDMLGGQAGYVLSHGVEEVRDVVVQQGLDFAAQVFVAVAGVGEKLLTSFWGLFQDVEEESFDDGPAVLVHTGELSPQARSLALIDGAGSHSAGSLRCPQPEERRNMILSY